MDWRQIAASQNQGHQNSKWTDTGLVRVKAPRPVLCYILQSDSYSQQSDTHAHMFHLYNIKQIGCVCLQEVRLSFPHSLEPRRVRG